MIDLPASWAQMARKNRFPSKDSTYLEMSQSNKKPTANAVGFLFGSSFVLRQRDVAKLKGNDVVQGFPVLENQLVFGVLFHFGGGWLERKTDLNEVLPAMVPISATRIEFVVLWIANFDPLH